MLLIELIILQASVILQIIINLSLSAISCGLFELLSQLTGKLCCFQSALSFYAEVFAIRSDDTVWFGHCTHFSQSHPHSCRKLYHVRHLEDQSSRLHNKSSNSIAITMLCIFSTIQSSMGKAMAPHSSTPAWKIPWTEERWAAVHGVSKSRARPSDFTFTFHFHALEKEMATHSSVLAWRIPGMGSLVGCRLWGHTESDTTEAT